jgi:hypothetical protein
MPASDCGCSPCRSVRACCSAWSAAFIAAASLADADKDLEPVQATSDSGSERRAMDPGNRMTGSLLQCSDVSFGSRTAQLKRARQRQAACASKGKIVPGKDARWDPGQDARPFSQESAFWRKATRF